MTASVRAEDVDLTIRSFPWMDFELNASSRWVAVVVGAVDESADPDLRITFRDIAALAMPTEWKSDTGNVVFREVPQARAFEVNKHYGIEQGYTLFEFVPEDSECFCIVAAKTVEFERLVKSSPSANE
jgi:hypothetical protein